MKTFRDFILAHPAAADCSKCEQPLDWPPLSSCLLDEIRETVDASLEMDIDLGITEMQELAPLVQAVGGGAPQDCQIIWEQFIRWQRQQTKLQQLGIAYGLSTAQ